MVAMVRAFRANEKICLIFSELTVDRGHVKVAKSFVTLTIRCYAMLSSWRHIFLMGNHLARIKSFFLQHPDAMRRLLLSLSLTLFTYEHKNNHLCRASFSYPHERASWFRWNQATCFERFVYNISFVLMAVPLKWFMGQLSCRSQAHSSGPSFYQLQVLSSFIGVFV